MFELLILKDTSIARIYKLDEVEEDASVAISIANAISLFYTNPKKLLETIAVTKPAY